MADTRGFEPITFSVNAVSRIRTAVFRGVVGDTDLITAYECLRRRPDYDPTLSELVDLRLVKRLEVSRPVLERLVSSYWNIDSLDSGGRFAVVVGDDTTPGVPRLYGVIREGDLPDDLVEIFRDVEAAVEWLSLAA